MRMETAQLAQNLVPYGNTSTRSVDSFASCPSAILRTLNRESHFDLPAFAPVLRSGSRPHLVTPSPSRFVVSSLDLTFCLCLFVSVVWAAVVATCGRLGSDSLLTHAQVGRIRAGAVFAVLKNSCKSKNKYKSYERLSKCRQEALAWKRGVICCPGVACGRKLQLTD